MDQDLPDLPSDLPLSQIRPQGCSFDLSRPISARLDKLSRLVTDEGRIHRKEILAALILGAPEDPQKLAKLIRDHRKATVRDCRLAESPDDKVVHLPGHGPGPRRHETPIVTADPRAVRLDSLKPPPPRRSRQTRRERRH